jgi:glycosyltransferase involved in cell wall biosynthesis
VDALQRGLETLLPDRTLRFRLGAAARKRILSDFSLDSVAEQLSALYHRLLNTDSLTG